jgi:hypothetical protein
MRTVNRSGFGILPTGCRGAPTQIAPPPSHARGFDLSDRCRCMRPRRVRRWNIENARVQSHPCLELPCCVTSVIAPNRGHWLQTKHSAGVKRASIDDWGQTLQRIQKLAETVAVGPTCTRARHSHCTLHRFLQARSGLLNLHRQTATGINAATVHIPSSAYT